MSLVDTDPTPARGIARPHLSNVRPSRDARLYDWSTERTVRLEVTELEAALIGAVLLRDDRRASVELAAKLDRQRAS